MLGLSVDYMTSSEIEEAKPKKELLDLAQTLIDQKSAPFDAGEFEDRYVEALKKLIDKKAKSKSGKKVIEDVDEPEAGSGGNVIDLMAALKKSVGDDKASSKSKSKAKKSA